MNDIVPEQHVLRSPLLPVPHGFFTRHGGVSPPPFDSLNGSLSSADTPDNIRTNRARIAQTLRVKPHHLLGLRQTHSALVHIVRPNTPLWDIGNGPEGDALITDHPQTAISVITADCGPLLLSSGDGRIVAAIHAGWRGAAGGVIDATVAALHALNATDIHAVIGPCIGPDVYEVGPDMHRTVLSLTGQDSQPFFQPAERKDHFLFDLSGYCAHRLKRAGVSSVETMHVDTLTDHRFFSHRRRTQAGGGHIGHQVSAICPGQHGVPL